MSPSKVDRSRLNNLTDLPNIGQAMARDLVLIGIRRPEDLAGLDPLDLYESLCFTTGRRQDPCVLDVFMSITDFMNGHPPRPWWAYTAARKEQYGRILAGLADQQSDETSSSAA